MKETALIRLSAALRSLDAETYILFGRHLSSLGRKQIATILERNFSEFTTPDYPDNYDCIFEASKTFKETKGRYPECEEEGLINQNKNLK